MFWSYLIPTTLTYSVLLPVNPFCPTNTPPVFIYLFIYFWRPTELNENALARAWVGAYLLAYEQFPKGPSLKNMTSLLPVGPLPSKIECWLAQSCLGNHSCYEFMKMAFRNSPEEPAISVHHSTLLSHQRSCCCCCCWGLCPRLCTGSACQEVVLRWTRHKHWVVPFGTVVLSCESPCWLDRVRCLCRGVMYTWFMFEAVRISTIQLSTQL